MSLLDTPTPPPKTQQEIAADKIRATQKFNQTIGQLLAAPRSMFLLWQAGVTNIWRNPDGSTPSEVLAGFGTNGAELFSMSADFAALLEKHSPGITAPVVAIIGQFTVHPDGTVTTT